MTGRKIYKKNLEDVTLQFCINRTSAHDREWVDVDIKINSPVISYNLKDWEKDGEIFELSDMKAVSDLMDKWLASSLIFEEEFETLEPDLLLRFYPGEEKRIDFCVCLQTKSFAFSSNYIVLSLEGKDAIEFVEYWKTSASELLHCG